MEPQVQTMHMAEDDICPMFSQNGGIAMLSAVLKSDIAVDVSIKIMDTFVRMRNFFISNKDMFSRLDRVELKQPETDKKPEEVFNYIASNTEVGQKTFMIDF